jgi:hypothetical protein
MMERAFGHLAEVVCVLEVRKFQKTKLKLLNNKNKKNKLYEKVL